ncbi:MAG: hypothetical protein K0R38_1362 [Polyangiaceae bacterium]|jgi:hypothetical protein|nr:hypothetical protein [Polyangiaceae bacterium]
MTRYARLWCIVLPMLAACTQVLGIEDARVDTSLTEPAITAGKGGALATSGSASTADGGDETSGPVATGGKSGNSSVLPGAAGVPNAGGSPDEPTPPTLCERYCDKVMTHCKGKYEQYRSFDQCIEVCKRLPPGQTGDEDVNTAECRVRQADFAESEPFVYCKSAGPLGTGKCGSNCVSYCSLMQSACTPLSTEGNLEPSYYDSSQACLEACGGIPTHEDDPTAYSSSASAEPSSFIGNTIYCRTYHLAAGLEQGAHDEHCPHAMGGDPCIEP